MTDIYTIDSYDYNLPKELIAQVPHDPVDECKLMVIDKKNGEISHTTFAKALSSLGDSYCIFFNNSKVVKARIPWDKIRVVHNNKEKNIIWWELFFIGPVGENTYKFMVKPWSKFKVWSLCQIGEYSLLISWDREYGRIITFHGDIFELLEKYGQMPLPPYIGYQKPKESLYQPVFAKEPGSVASPTASLHFTPSLLEHIHANGVVFDYITLHVWIGTFRTIKVTDIHDYNIHEECCEVDIHIFSRIADYKLLWKKLIAIGTTTCRTLESLCYLWMLLDNAQKWILCPEKLQQKFWDNIIEQYDSNHDYIHSFQITASNIQFECKLFIKPWFVFTVVDELITNFHLPKSSLMILVASILGYNYMMNAYAVAIEQNYMFYSFGDAMRIR